MSSVQSQVECPRCNSDNCFYDYYYNSGEECVRCLDCGYYQSYFYKRNNEGEYIKKDATKGYEYENLVSEEVHIENPYGVYRLEFASKNFTIGTLVTKEDYKKFVSELPSLINQLDTGEFSELCTASVKRYLHKKIKEETIYEREVKNE